MNELTRRTESFEDTMELAALLAGALQQGDVVALIGELGAGKTVFVKGMARGIEVEKNMLVTSPTFVILQEYPGRLPLYHFDFYRLTSREQVETTGYEEYFEADGVCAVEWADRFPELLPPSTIRVDMKVEGETRRLIKVSPGPAVTPGHWEKIRKALEDKAREED